MNGLAHVIDTPVFWWVLIMAFFGFLWLECFRKINSANQDCLEDIRLERIALAEERERVQASWQMEEWLAKEIERQS